MHCNLSWKYIRGSCVVLNRYNLFFFFMCKTICFTSIATLTLNIFEASTSASTDCFILSFSKMLGEDLWPRFDSFSTCSCQPGHWILNSILRAVTLHKSLKWSLLHGPFIGWVVYVNVRSRTFPDIVVIWCNCVFRFRKTNGVNLCCFVACVLDSDEKE